MQTTPLPVAVLLLAFSCKNHLPKRTPVFPFAPPIHKVFPRSNIPQKRKLSNSKNNATTRFSEKRKDPKDERNTLVAFSGSKRLEEKK